jgi:hypothetical protein
MQDDEQGLPPQTPYREWNPPREARSPREISAGVVACFMLLLILIVSTLSAEPSSGESFGGLWHSGEHSQVAHHRR